MKSLSIVGVLLIACLCILDSYVPAVSAQDDDSSLTQASNAEQNKATTALEDATAKLADSLNKRPPDKLTNAAKPFLIAARNPSNITGLHSATEGLRVVLSELKTDSNFQPGERVTAATEAIRASDNFQKLASQNSSATSRQAKNNDDNTNTKTDSGWLGWLWPILGGVAGLGLVILMVFGVIRLMVGFWEKLDAHLNQIVQAQVAGIKRRQDEAMKSLALLAEEQERTFTSLDSLRVESQALSRAVRQGVLDGAVYQAASASRRAFDVQRGQVAKPEEPAFPAFAGEYLNKMKGNAVVVKPDFQNGILVNDVDGKGELVLIRDSNIPDDAQPLFVVPRVTQFQTKQEFYAYYEKYYDCQRPSAGEVWIIDPAVVSTVPGGWQLREKGVLEVR